MPEQTAEVTFNLEDGEERDLDSVVLPQAVAPTVPTEKPYNGKKAADDARRNIAYALLALLIVVVIIALTAVMIVNGSTLDVVNNTASDIQANDAKADADRLVAILNVVFGPVVTLLGTATGFYFGSQTKNVVGE
jgi:hypothetical protein